MKIETGMIVKVKNNRPEQWFKIYPEFLEITVNKVFKNGNFSGKIKTKFRVMAQHWHESEVVEIIKKVN